MCKFRHVNSPRCGQVLIGLCAKRICQFTHSEQYVFCENQSCQLKHSELYVLCQSQDKQEYELQKRAQLIMGKVTDPLRKFCKCPLRKLCQCHDMDGELKITIPCKKGDICKLRHENIPRCERVDFGLCADRFCKFKHSFSYVVCTNKGCQLKHSGYVTHNRKYTKKRQDSRHLLP